MQWGFSYQNWRYVVIYHPFPTSSFIYQGSIGPYGTVSARWTKRQPSAVLLRPIRWRTISFAIIATFSVKSSICEFQRFSLIFNSRTGSWGCLSPWSHVRTHSALTCMSLAASWWNLVWSHKWMRRAILFYLRPSHTFCGSWDTGFGSWLISRRNAPVISSPVRSSLNMRFTLASCIRSKSWVRSRSRTSILQCMGLCNTESS